MHALVLLTMLIAASGDLSTDRFDMFAEVLDRGVYGSREDEAAAFIVRRPDGGERCVLWPPTAEYHQTHYRWPPPAGVVAIVHTHPLAMPRPSGGDRASAIRLGIPVYSITPDNIYKTDEFGLPTAVVKNHRWFREHDSRRGLCAYQ